MTAKWTSALLVKAARHALAFGLNATATEFNTTLPALKSVFQRNGISIRQIRFDFNLGPTARPPVTLPSSCQQEIQAAGFLEALLGPPGERQAACPSVSAIEDYSGGCKWPIGDPEETGFHFCCRPKPLLKPYCPKHAKMSRLAFSQCS